MCSEVQRNEAIAELTILVENVERALNNTLHDKAPHSQRERTARIQSYERRIAALKFAIQALQGWAIKYEFSMNDREAEAATKWKSEHVCGPARWRFWNAVRRARSYPYPSFTYAFTPTGIGVAVTISCHCGSEKNITDYDCW